MIQFYRDEEWKDIGVVGAAGQRYVVSNYGRVVSYIQGIKDGRLLKCSQTKGYKQFRVRQVVDGKPKQLVFYVHKQVALLFIPKQSNDQVYVIHLDYQKDNNHTKNLRWANKQELEEHQNKNPKVINDRKRLQEHNRLNQYKLSEGKVKIIKRKLARPKQKTRLKMIARAFGISEMQLYRIRTGENWGHIKP
jgi:hypothetical protein